MTPPVQLLKSIDDENFNVISTMKDLEKDIQTLLLLMKASPDISVADLETLFPEIHGFLRAMELYKKVEERLSSDFSELTSKLVGIHEKKKDDLIEEVNELKALQCRVAIVDAQNKIKNGEKRKRSENDKLHIQGCYLQIECKGKDLAELKNKKLDLWLSKAEPLIFRKKEIDEESKQSKEGSSKDGIFKKIGQIFSWLKQISGKFIKRKKTEESSLETEMEEKKVEFVKAADTLMMSSLLGQDDSQTLKTETETETETDKDDVKSAYQRGSLFSLNSLFRPVTRGVSFAPSVLARFRPGRR